MSAQPNFYLWGAWKSRTIKEPFLTKKVAAPLKKVVLGESYIIALEEGGQVRSWGKDLRNYCLGLGEDQQQADTPQKIDGLKDVTDIQMGQDHVVALTRDGEVYCWGKDDKGQLGRGQTQEQEYAARPQKVEALNNEQIMQIAVVRNSTFALSTSGIVYAWGDNKDNVLGLEEQSRDKVPVPVRLTILREMRVRKIEIFENRTIIAHVRAPENEDMVPETGPEDKDQEETEIFRGIDMMREAMEKTMEWWKHLLAIKFGQPNDPVQDVAGEAQDGMGPVTIQDDMDVDIERLKRADKHLDALLNAAIKELKKTHQQPGTKNVRFILCMFIDECRLRREKVRRTISARKILDLKSESEEISAYSVTDFGGNSNEEIRKIIAVTSKLTYTLENVRKIQTVDMLSQQLKVTLMECLECKLQLHETRVELLKAAEAKPSSPMLPALRIIKDRWNTLKQFSLFALYLECEENKDYDFGGNDVEHLQYLVRESNRRIDQMLQIDKDRIISQDTLVPALCYDLLRENAELRKMTNSYQLHVLMLHQRKNIPGPYVGQGRGDASPPALNDGEGSARATN